MMRLLFERRLNYVDRLHVAVGAVLVSNGHWLIAVLTCLAGAAVSAVGEHRLRWSKVKP